MYRQTLECQDIVLRAVLRRRNIDRENSRLLAAAFLLRTRQDGTKEKGLSVSYDCSPAECAAGFDKCHGVASLHVGRVRNLGLDVIPDKVDHANIVGLPHPEDDPAEAERFASKLRRQARLVWQP
jgi:hypothetical protein